MTVDTMRSTGKDRWQAKSLRSTFGNQCVSQLPTSPSCGFGSAVREAASKVRLWYKASAERPTRQLPWIALRAFCSLVLMT